MAPAVTIDSTSDFPPVRTKTAGGSSHPRSLLLSPPSLSSRPEKLNNVLAAHDRNATDIQMLDRLSLSLVSLPEATYDIILILADADNTRTESKKLLDRDVLSRIVLSLRPGGRLKSQDGNFATDDAEERREAIFAGLLVEGNDVVKPDHRATQSIPLRFGKSKSNGGTATTNAGGTGAVSLNLNRKRKNGPPALIQPAGFGYVDANDNFGTPEVDDDDDLIDEDTLLDEEDLRRPVVQPPECRPKAGKRRRACKDCTCGLAQRLEAEDEAKRSNADQALAKLKMDELAEVDFTVQGKVGSCGNCALGDAFRCDGCPYVGLPAFKPGEEVRLINDEVQLSQEGLEVCLKSSTVPEYELKRNLKELALPLPVILRRKALLSSWAILLIPRLSPADMGNPQGPAHLITTARNHFAHPRSGKFQIDIIINNAGVAKNMPLEKVTSETFTNQYTVNVLGPILLLQAALPFLPTDRSGRIVNLSSVSSSLGFHGQTVYGGTKAALEAMTRTWSRELAERATVNAVNPGPVATDMYGSTSPEFQQQMKPFMQNAPLQRVRGGIDDEKFVKDAELAGGRPAYDHEIAGVVAMLCSEDSAWCTGSVVSANGGFKFSY
ncbi:MAG: electron carrier [Alectoria sarmentosa]|nr:MAG: electron carrier [Alectoria sarmentosa]